MGTLQRWWRSMVGGPDFASRSSVAATIGWWERRRLAYNALLLALGAPSYLLYTIALQHAAPVPPGQDLIEPLVVFAAFFAAIAAYTGGWIVEALVGGGDSSVRVIRSRLMRAGLTLSAMALWVPSLVWLATWALKLAHHRAA